MSELFKKELFQKIKKKLAKGEPLDDIEANALQLKEALRMGTGDEYIRQSGMYVPSGKSISRLEQFYGDILKDSLGIDSGVKMDASQFKNTPRARGKFRPSTGEIFLNPKLAENITSGTSTAIHEGIHKRDYLNNPDFIPDKLDPSRMDKKSSPIQQLRQAVGQHHLLKNNKEILEESLLKNILAGVNKFGKLGTALPVVGTAIGLASGDASAAVSSPAGSMIDSESVGPVKGSDEAIFEDPERTQEERRMALERLKSKFSNN